jgi:hypothetical protein
MQTDAVKLISHPLVLRSAWRRVKSWYEAGESPPTAEWIRWQINSSRELLGLAEELTVGTYRPAPFRLVPYPKKGGILRHYSIPSIRDQVLFTALGILLAPFFEAQMPNFSFGNRWYRSTYRRYPESTLELETQASLFEASKANPLKGPVWDHRPFSLSDRKAYQPYARSHGLFRRVAHWTATSMLRVAATDTTATDLPK